MAIRINSERDINLIKKSCELTANTLNEIGKHVKPGVTTLELDKIAEDYIRKNNATPAFLGYRGFPATICISVNEEIVHGIPSNRKLQSGDIVGIDVGVLQSGYYGDSARTYKIGNVSKKAEQLVNTTKVALDTAIKFAKPGYRLYDISYAIESIATSKNYSVVKDYTGHGIGIELHEEPHIFNYVPKGMRGKGKKIKQGMVFAIEPMINIGGSKTKVLDNDWTVVTADGSLSAHFEHTIAITDGEPLILTGY